MLNSFSGLSDKTSMPEPPHLQSSKSTTNTSTHTVNTNTVNTTIVHPQRTQKQVGQVSDDTRDPMLVTLEKYLLQNLRASDVMTGEDGILLFNINQVAYIMEGSATNKQQNSTRSRLKDAVPSLQVVTRKCPRSGRGKSKIRVCTCSTLTKWHIW
jgi:hypothetical protein